MSNLHQFNQFIMSNLHQFNQFILSWYDQHRRFLIWRHPPPCDPYKVWLSEMMLQQTTTMTVARYYKDFLNRWPTVYDLAATTIDAVLHAWQGLGYYARARNLHRCAQDIVQKFQGVFPDTEKELITLPGVGSYSAAAIVAIAFNKSAVVLDTNIIRIISRIFAIKEIIKPHNAAFAQVKEKAAFVMSNTRPADYAQALMDLGATVCTAKNPQCLVCPVQQFCQAFALGIQEAVPAKPLKPIRPVRHMIFWILFNKNKEIAFIKRPAKGLLGGLMAFPLSFWDQPEQQPPPFPFQTTWEVLPSVQHVFTHFTAHVHLYKTENVDEKTFPAYRWCALSEVHSLALPTMVKKALKNII